MLQNYYKKKLQKKTARGVIVIDKEAGITSHDEVDRFQKIYDCEIIFHKKISKERFEQVMEQFTGTIVQLPPVKSSVKRVERERDVYGLKLLSFASDGRRASIRCSVERGTYIRKLCHDMGEVLGVGAHMGDLRRITAGPFSLENSKPISTKELRRLKAKAKIPLVGWWYIRKIIHYIDPIERVLEGFPRVTVDGRLAKIIASGADLFAPGVLSADQVCVGDLVQIVDEGGTALALGEALMGGTEMQEKEKGVAVRITKRLCG